MRVFILIFVLLSFSDSVLGLEKSANNLRFGMQGDMTRVVLDLSDEVDYRIFLLDDPVRVVVDLPNTRWLVPEASKEKSKGLVDNYRFGQFRENISRLVLDISGYLIIKHVFSLPPLGSLGHRLVIDLLSADRDDFLAFRSQGAILSRPAVEAMITALEKPRIIKDNAVSAPLIIIDPGHGGIDPGAISRYNDYEKDITLKYAKTLRDKLLKNGYRVLLTRDKDYFVSLKDRVKQAREASSSLFVSLHADSNTKPSIRGLSVYTLSRIASDREAEKLALNENRSDIIAGVDLSAESDEVTSILIDLTQRETMNYSIYLASRIIKELRGKVDLLRRTHRSAGFAVLKAPDIPSVLVELGYLSNEYEASKLVTERYRGKLTDAIAQAIDIYFSWRSSSGELN